MSKSPNPTTTSPMTAPLLNAIRNPRLRLWLTAFAVRAEAYVAVFIPKKPHSPEKIPPVRKAKGTHGFCTLSTYDMKANTRHSMMKIIATTLYCCLRYAIAPMRTYPAISFMRSVPSSSFIMLLKKYQAMANAHTEAIGTSQNTDGMFIVIVILG